MRMRLVTAAIAVALVGVAGSARASTVTYSSLATWQAAVGTTTSISFEENGPTDYTYYGGSATFSGITFSVAGDLFTIDPDYPVVGYADIGTGDVLSAQ